MLIRNAEIEGAAPIDLRIDDGHVSASGVSLERRTGEPVLDADGGALLPGLHDHHLHLFALAASLDSVRCGPPDVRTPADLERSLQSHSRRRSVSRAGATTSSQSTASSARQQWLRGIGYCESVAGPLDRWALDHWVADRPVRIQHRSGALWILNSEAVTRLRLDHCASPGPGLERDDRGRITGRLFRLDDWLRERLEEGEADPCDRAGHSIPSLEAVGKLLSRFGVTGLTDATPANGPVELRAFSAAMETGALPQSLRLMGSADLPQPELPGLVRGAVKIMLDDSSLPDFDSLALAISEAHSADRAVAVHCVTRVELVFTLAAFSSAGTRPGDRIEHAAIAPPDLVAQMAALGLTVVTQPNFIHERGDAYAVNVDPIDREWLYRGAGFLADGVPLGGGTDAPFGDPDPWLAIRSAVSRRSADGIVLGRDEGLAPEAALALFTTPLEQPGGRPRRVAVGSPADLCLLDRPWQAFRRELSSDHVRATLRAGRIIWQRPGSR
jgi:predicted amidohydrolase YtcJ